MSKNEKIVWFFLLFGLILALSITKIYQEKIKEQNNQKPDKVFVQEIGSLKEIPENININGMVIFVGDYPEKQLENRVFVIAVGDVENLKDKYVIFPQDFIHEPDVSYIKDILATRKFEQDYPYAAPLDFVFVFSSKKYEYILRTGNNATNDGFVGKGWENKEMQKVIDKLFSKYPALN
ncbi:MAG: hypothetical protein ACP5OG_02105 [Candidatus Nanoarchaeia archaeon]